jgi:hypothetical protein
MIARQSFEGKPPLELNPARPVRLRRQLPDVVDSRVRVRVLALRI